MKVRRKCWLLLALGLGGLQMRAQEAASTEVGRGAAAVPTHYDVISVRPNRLGSGPWGVDDNDGTITATNITVTELLTDVLEMQRDLVSGLPDWASTERYDIQAKVLEADPKLMKHMTDEQDRVLLLSILEDRFGFKAHFETRTLPVYDLQVAKGGLLVRPVAKAAQAEGAEPEAESGGIEIGNNLMKVTTATMPRVAQSLRRQVQRTVIDRTGLSGQYSFTVKFAPERQANEAEAGLPDAPPTIFVALEQQVGLKLVSDKGPVRTLVVEHVEQPVAN